MWYLTGVWYVAGERTSVYLTAELTAAVKASGIPLAELSRRGLTAADPAAAAATTDRPVTLPAGEPCPGAVCSGPGCWQRDTSRYGLRSLVLCTACAAALQGQQHKREMLASAVRLARRGAA